MMRRLVLALATLVLAGGGCGGSDDEPGARQPALPAAVADELVARSDRVALMLARGDSCAADTQAEALRAAANAAVASGRVPRPLQRELLGAVTSLAGQIECTPPEPVTAPRDDGDKDEEKGKDKEKDEDKGKDEEKDKDKEKEHKDDEKGEGKKKEKDDKEEDE